MKIKTMVGEDMQQLFIGAEPQQEKFQAVTNQPAHTKPQGGLWTSTFDPTRGSDWVEWSNYYNWYDGTPDAWLLTPRDDAKFIIIDTYRDLEEMMERYSKPFDGLKTLRTIDFETMSGHYDGIHLTERGQAETRLSHPFNLYGWDVECFLWFRWVFESVERVEFKKEWNRE